MSKKKKTKHKKTEEVVEAPVAEAPEEEVIVIEDDIPKEAPKVVRPVAPVAKKVFKKNLVRLDRYARNLVGTRNVELVNAWANQERKNKKFHDTQENYRVRYEEFKRS